MLDGNSKFILSIRGNHKIAAHKKWPTRMKEKLDPFFSNDSHLNYEIFDFDNSISLFQNCNNILHSKSTPGTV